ncbi:MAG: four helix bundle protein [Clostridium sp.]|nr:four helix bundle protein [Clostridium sp.]MCM1443962.1 four helix bundle protein [Candidatus Amulumruptor caecigallinarius]
MLQVSRSNNLKIPKEIKYVDNNINSFEDKVAIKSATGLANNERVNVNKIHESIDKDEDIKLISKIPSNSSDLIVITVVKKLGAYVIAITEKSPKKFRGVFVNRMQNYCLDALELLLQANYIRMDSFENKKKRENFQKDALIKLKLLGYISLLAENCGCILKKQNKQISIQLAEGINLIVAWKKSDDERWKKRI